MMRGNVDLWKLYQSKKKFYFFLRKNLEKGKCLTYLCIVI